MQTILVISDDHVLQSDLRDALPRLGYATVTASDGRAAFRLLDRDVPNLMVLCLDLAAGNALELLLQIRLRGPTPPLLAMAALERPAFDKRMSAALKFGADMVLTRPVEPAILFEAVERLIKSA